MGLQHSAQAEALLLTSLQTVIIRAEMVAAVLVETLVEPLLVKPHQTELLTQVVVAERLAMAVQVL
jgi:hypothetical protein